MNESISRGYFSKITDPGLGNPAITSLGFSLCQNIAGVDTYTYTAMKGRQAITLAWLNVSQTNLTITDFAGRREVKSEDLPVIVAGLISSHPELQHPFAAIKSVS